MCDDHNTAGGLVGGLWYRQGKALQLYVHVNELIMGGGIIYHILKNSLLAPQYAELFP